MIWLFLVFFVWLFWELYRALSAEKQVKTRGRR